MYNSPKIAFDNSSGEHNFDLNILTKNRSLTFSKNQNLFAPKFKQKIIEQIPSPIKESIRFKKLTYDSELSEEEDNNVGYTKSNKCADCYKNIQKQHNADVINNARENMKRTRLYSCSVIHSKDDTKIKYLDILKNVKLEPNFYRNNRLSKTVKFNSKREFLNSNNNINNIDMNISKTYGVFNHSSKSLTYWGLQKKKSSSILGYMQVNRYLKDNDDEFKNLY